MRRFGLIGTTLGASRSPEIHHIVFQRLGLEAQYDLYEAPTLEEALEKVRRAGLDGFNVTMPFKEAIIPFLDALDETASAMGAVNTVVIKEGRWTGYNTDGAGFIQAMATAGFNASCQRVLVLGAGGAARAIVYMLLREGARSVQVLNRSLERADLLVQHMKAIDPSWALEVCPRLEAVNPSAIDWVVQTTSVGMAPSSDEMPMALEGFSKPLVVCDIIYKPHETKLLQKAKQQGHRIVYGIDMLIGQALVAEALWLEASLDFSTLMSDIRETLLK